MITIYGQNAILAVFKNNPNRIKKLFIKGSLPKQFDKYAKSVQIERIDNRAFDKLLPDKSHQGIAAHIEEKSSLPLNQLQDAKTVAILDGITDIHNVGAIIRSAYAFGLDAIILNKKLQILKKADVYKTSAGYIEMLDIIEVTNLADSLKALKKMGFWVFGMQLEKSQNISSINEFEKKALVLGAEGSGIRPLHQKLCDAFVSIPIRDGCDSLNVSVAAAIAFWECL